MLRFVHISDTHINPNAEPQYGSDDGRPPTIEAARALVAEINALPFAPDFVLHTGDVAYDPDPDAYEVCLDILSGINYPVYYLAGNHDHSPSLQRIMLGRNEPVPDLYYAFDMNGVQFICLDSNGPAEPPAGSVSTAQLEWLSGLCQADDERPLVIAIHHNPLPVGIPWLDQYMGLRNGEALHQAVLPARHRLRGVFFGHVHQNLDIYRDGILYCSTLSGWYQLHAWPGMVDMTRDYGAEPGYSVVMITPQQTFIRRHRFALKPET